MTSLTVLGSAGGAPTRTNPASGYLLESRGTTIWVDAGTGTFMELARFTDPGALDAVVLSHIHVDHCSDIYGLYGYLAFGPSGVVPVPVFLPLGAADHLAAFARAGEEHVFHTVLDLTEVDAGTEVDVGDISLRFGRAVHPVPTLVTRFDTSDGSLAYSGDTGPGSDLADLAVCVDTLLCEATIGGERDAATYPYHLTAAEAGGIAAEAGASALILTHLAAGLDQETSRSEAVAVFGDKVSLAMPGSTFTIGEQI